MKTCIWQKNKYENSIIMSDAELKPKLIGQGTYGCVYYPGIKCGRKQPKNPKEYVSKIQSRASKIDNEVNIGKVIQRIKNFRYFFAPIIENCNVDISTLDNKAIESCDLGINKSNKTKFISNKIIYAGKESIGKQINQNMEKIVKTNIKIKNGSTFVTKTGNKIKKVLTNIIENHIYLLESLLLLEQQNILHCDLKENNIIVDKRNDVVIIIDFGLSKDMNVIKTAKNYRDGFANYSRYETYPTWGIELILFMYICINVLSDSDINFANLNQRIDSLNKLKEIVHSYVEGDEYDNRHMNIDATLKKRYEIKILHYINSFIGKTWREMWDDLLASRNTWDSYSLAQVFYYELYKLGFNENSLQQYFMKSYTNLLTEVLLSEPCKRLKTPELIDRLKMIIKSVKKKEINAYLEKLKETVSKENYLKAIDTIQDKHSYVQNIMDTILEEKH